MLFRCVSLCNVIVLRNFLCDTLFLSVDFLGVLQRRRTNECCHVRTTHTHLCRRAENKIRGPSREVCVTRAPGLDEKRLRVGTPRVAQENYFSRLW